MRCRVKNIVTEMERRSICVELRKGLGLEVEKTEEEESLGWVKKCTQPEGKDGVEGEICLGWIENEKGLRRDEAQKWKWDDVVQKRVEREKVEGEICMVVFWKREWREWAEMKIRWSERDRNKREDDGCPRVKETKMDIGSEQVELNRRGKESLGRSSY